MPGGRNSGAVYNLYKVSTNEQYRSFEPQIKGSLKAEQIKQHPTELSEILMKNNYFKVKYKKHKKNPKNGQVKGGASEKMNQQKSSILPEQNLPSHVVNGTILKTALTNPSEVSNTKKPNP